MNWGVHLYWFFWLAIGFLAVELWAVLTHKKVNTLSNTSWIWLGTFSHPANRKYRLAIFTAFWFGLYIHLAFGVPALATVVITGIPFGALIIYSTFIKHETQ